MCHNIRPSTSHTFRQWLVCCLLLMSAALPLHAWAVDTDGDGVDDSLDAFPNNAEATTDTDGDGKPDSIDYSRATTIFSDSFSGVNNALPSSTNWSYYDYPGSTFEWHISTSSSHSGGSSVVGPGAPSEPRLSKKDPVTVPSGGLLSFWTRSNSTTCRKANFWLDGVDQGSMINPLGVWTQRTYVLSPGVHTDISWLVAGVSGLGGATATCFYLDDVTIQTSSLVLDNDDDNDGVLDVADAFPSNLAASVDTDKDGMPDQWNAANTFGCAANALTCNGLTRDLDNDNDGVPNTSDNCSLSSNAFQEDEDYDGVGNVCDSDASGRLDSTFNPGVGGNGGVETVAVQADGKILIGGYFTSYKGTARAGIARLNADGSLDASFNPGAGANSDIMSIAVQADGKILIVGNFTSYNGTAIKNVARLNADGTLDAGFIAGTGGNSLVYAFALQADGKILIGGAFTFYNGTAINKIARLNADGLLDAGFNPGTGASSDVYSVAVQADGKIVIGGYFTSYNGTAINRIARLNADGSLDASFNPGAGANTYVEFVDVQADGKILIGGNFTTYNGTAINRIARLNADGTLDAGFNPGTGANSNIKSIAVQADGKILIGGSFTSYNGTARNYIARLNADGSQDANFYSGSGTNNTVYSVAVAANGKIFIGGTFTSYDGMAAAYIASIHSGDADQDGIENAADYFSTNAAASTDADHDGLPDAWLQPNSFSCTVNNPACNGLTLDAYIDTPDADGIPTATDNCLLLYNPDQQDTDSDGVGDVCDADNDNDGVLNYSDKFPLNAAASADGDNDGLPDNWNQPNAYGCAMDAATCNGLTLDTQIPQTITFIQPAPSGAVYNASFVVAATASSGLPVSVAASGGCSLAGDVVTMISSTTACTLAYSQAGNASYNPVTVSSTTTASKAAQSITVTQPAPASAAYGTNFTVAATASSGLAVSISASGGCSISGNAVTITGNSDCTLSYTQAGNGNYSAAAPINSTTVLSVWPLNGTYKGSTVSESRIVQ